MADRKLPPGIRRAPRNPDRFEVRYRDPRGHQRTRTFATITSARAFLVAMRTDVARGVWRDPALGRVRVDERAAHVEATRSIAGRALELATRPSCERGSCRPPASARSARSRRPT
jgi:hypothetical protein